MSNRITPEISTGAMADIAFLLLIFFLVTTTIEDDMGIMRKLPPDAEPPQIETKKRNTMVVLVNRENKLMVRNNPMDITQLRAFTKKFVANPNYDKNFPERKAIIIPLIGKYDVCSQHIISIQSDRGTSYETYITVQNELTAAYNELRQELSIQKFGKDYTKLNRGEKDAIDEVYAMNISEANPVNTAEL